MWCGEATVSVCLLAVNSFPAPDPTPPLFLFKCGAEIKEARPWPSKFCEGDQTSRDWVDKGRNVKRHRAINVQEGHVPLSRLNDQRNGKTGGMEDTESKKQMRIARESEKEQRKERKRERWRGRGRTQ